MKKQTLVFTFAVISCLSMAQAATAQVNPRLDNWLGCWRLEDDLAGTGARLCVTPEPDGVRLQTLVGTVKGADEVVIPDGAARPIADSECKGTERSEWSSDGQRVFRAIDVTCKNETPRAVKGVMFVARGPMLINVQHVTGGGTAAGVRVQRYRRAQNQTLADGSKAPQPRTASVTIDSTWSIEDVIEASKKLPPEALQGALADVRQKFNVNRRTLVALDDAGVPDSVIDLMVALTFPERFVVERVASSAPIGVTTGMSWYDPFMSPLLRDPFMSSCYGYRSYYSTCGYYYGYNTFSPYGSIYPYYDNYYVPGGWVAVNPNNPGGDVAPQPSGAGRVVNGRGYTQIRERSPEPSAPRTSNRGDGSAAGWSGAGSGGVSSGGYSSGSSSGGSSGGGSSSGGGGDRVAVPRPPGGGN
jgi:uncharacterized membrane protein YgcG